MRRARANPQPKLAPAQAAELTQAAQRAHALFSSHEGHSPEEIALYTALGVGGWAARNGLPREGLAEWLQSAYGRVWVIGGHLNPGADAKDVLREILRGYDGAMKRLGREITSGPWRGPRNNPDALGVAALAATAAGMMLLLGGQKRPRAVQPGFTEGTWSVAPVPDRPGQREYTRAVAGKVYIILHDPRTKRAFLDVMSTDGSVRRIKGPGRFGQFSSVEDAQARVDGTRTNPRARVALQARAQRGNPDVIVSPKNLPPSVQMHLPSRNVDVRVRPGPWRPPVGGDGRRGIVIVAALADGRNAQQHTGAWGGASPFGRTIDEHPGGPVPRGMFALTYTQGSGHPYPVLYVHPDDLVPQVEAAPDLSEDEAKALNILGGITSSYRADEWARKRLPGRYGATNPVVQALVRRGLAKTTATGGVQITTAGKNARERLPNRYNPGVPGLRKGAMVEAINNIESAEVGGRRTVARHGAIGTVLRTRPDLVVRFSRERGQHGGDVVCGRDEVRVIAQKLPREGRTPHAGPDPYLEGLTPRRSR